MDLSQIDDDGDSAAMALAMGFSSFGAQETVSTSPSSSHPSKKRRYNPRADAAVVANPNAASSAPPEAPTGANATTLSQKARPPPQNTNEIDLGDEEADGSATDLKAEDISGQDNTESGRVDPHDAPALAHAQELIDDIVSRPAADGTKAATNLPVQPGAGNGISLPNRPSNSWGQDLPGSLHQAGGYGHDQGARHGQRQGQGQGQGPGHGQRDQEGRRGGKPWWEGYYDRKSNENPWRHLEEKAGLEPQGSWVL